MSGLLVVSSAHRLPLASATFHACVTSPPYYGLRSYEGDQVIEWPPVEYAPMSGLDPILLPGCWPFGCEHEWITEKVYSTRTRNTRSSEAFSSPGEANAERLKKARWTEHCWCSKCGGWRGGLGAEPAIEMYIGHMILVCREIFRVLRPDGTFWLNMGDSFNGSGGAGGDYGPGGIREGQPKYPGRSDRNLRAGDLMMIPARIALALQADGWILRNDNVWLKQAQPEPRKGWRYERKPCPCVTELREMHIQRQMAEQGVPRHRIFDKAGTKFDPDPECDRCHGSGRYGPHEFRPESWRHSKSHEFVFQFAKKMRYYSNHFQAATPTGANPKSVLMPRRVNYSGKHFAVFPPTLISPLIRASTPKRCCPICGTPWAPVVEDKVVTDYWATCECSIVNEEQPRGGPYPPVPGLVLDPFMGSGTTGLVAREFGVDFVGSDISFQYLDKQAKIRSKTGQPSGALDGLPLFDLEVKP